MHGAAIIADRPQAPTSVSRLRPADAEHPGQSARTEPPRYGHTIGSSKIVTDNPSDSFLPFDLDSTFVSSVIVLTAGPATAGLLDPGPSWTQRGTPILDEMVTRGNRIAAYNRSELEQLRGMLEQLDDKTVSHGGMPSPQIECGMPEGLTTAEILAVAESIDTGDVDWIAHAVTENSIW